MPTYDDLVHIYRETRDSYRAMQQQGEEREQTDAEARRECLTFVRTLYGHLAAYLGVEAGEQLELDEQPHREGDFWGYAVRVALPNDHSVTCLLLARIEGDYYRGRVLYGVHDADFPLPRSTEGTRGVSEQALARKAEPLFHFFFDTVARVIREHAATFTSRS